MPPHHATPPARQEENGLKLDVELTGEHLKEVVRRFKGVYERAGKTLPHDPYEQVRRAAGGRGRARRRVGRVLTGDRHPICQEKWQPSN